MNPAWIGFGVHVVFAGSFIVPMLRGDRLAGFLAAVSLIGAATTLWGIFW